MVEQRIGNITYYPHTEQLPQLHRALNLEFLGALPGRIARVDKRADGFHKILLRHAGLYYSTMINAARTDGLLLYSLPDADLVTRLVIVQQIMEDTPLGRVHRFRFYGPEGFFPEVRLSGKRIAFADHVRLRFSQRVPKPLGTDFTKLLMAFYGTDLIGMPVGAGRAFVVGYHDSILAFTYKESDEEYFLTTCLTVNEINSLRAERPVQQFHFHYGETFTAPANCPEPVAEMEHYLELWKQRAPLAADHGGGNKYGNNWPYLAQRVRDIALVQGHGPGSQVLFENLIPGPRLMTAYPLKPCAEGEKLRARLFAKNPELENSLRKDREAQAASAQIHEIEVRADELPDDWDCKPK